MRIGQLARKLDIPPSKIINYLEGLGIEMDKGVNTKLVQAGVEKVMDEFGKVEMEELTVSEPEVKKEVQIETQTQTEEKAEISNETEENNSISTDLEPEDDVAEEEVNIKPIDAPTEQSVDTSEVIRPEYVKLQGLKVVDKIDLPEPKPKEVPSETPEAETEIEATPVEKVEKEESHIITEEDIKADLKRHYDEERRKSRKPKPKPVERKKRPPLTYEQKLEREQKQALKKKLEQEKKIKELKRKKYEESLKKVQQAPVKKSKPKKKEPISFPVKEKYKKEPTSLWGKFMKWLNT